MKEFFGMFTWVGWLNILMLQWFFIRLAYREEKDGKKSDFCILYWVIPLTGWWFEFWYVGRKEHTWPRKRK